MLHVSPRMSGHLWPLGRPRIRFTMLACAGLIAWALAGSAATAQDRPLAADFPEVYRVGGLSAPEWALFTNPTRMGWRDGRFGIVDIGHGAYQLFTPNGELERFVRMSSIAGEAGAAAARSTVRPDPDGGAVIAEGVGLMAWMAVMLAEATSGKQVACRRRSGETGTAGSARGDGDRGTCRAGEALYPR